jgi:hypothetical protein
MDWANFYLHPHHWVFIYFVTLVVLIYRPPRILRGVGPFLVKHFGDTLALFLLVFGVALVVFGDFYPQLKDVAQIGQSLVMTAVGLLKLTSVSTQPAPPTNLKAQP